jgi:hypothetical protein
MSGCGTPASSQASCGVVAGLLDRRDDVVRVFLHGVVHRRVEIGLRAVVVDAETPADVDQRRAGAHLVQPHEDAAGLPERVLVGPDRRDLRADVEVQQLETAQHVLGAQALDRLHDLERGEPELGAVSRRLDPLSSALGGETRAKAQMRADSQLPGGLQHEIDLVEAVDHDHGRPAQLLREQRELHVGAVLVAVADHQRAGCVEQCERHQKLGLAPGLDPHAELCAVLNDLFDDVALLIHLDRVHAAQAALVLVLPDRRLERARDAPHAARQDVGEPQEHGRAQPAALEVIDQVAQVDARLLAVARTDLDVSLRVDREEPGAPVADVVELETVGDGPAVHRGHLLEPAAGESEAPYL